MHVNIFYRLIYMYAYAVIAVFNNYFVRKAETCVKASSVRVDLSVQVMIPGVRVGRKLGGGDFFYVRLNKEFFFKISLF